MAAVNLRRLSFLVILLLRRLRRKRTKRNRIWAKEWLQRREAHGVVSNLQRELREEDPEGFQRFLRMNSRVYDDLLAAVAPLISKRDTFMRKAISPNASYIHRAWET